ncbi:hypothetical protein LEMLEM_LOCUS13001 [Lemmus lemmus]
MPTHPAPCSVLRIQN